MVRCAYCRNSIRIERYEPRFGRRAPHVIYVNARPRRPLSAGGILTVFALLLLPVVFAVGKKVVRQVQHLLSPWPAICDANQELLIVDKTYTATGSEPLIQIHGNCRVTVLNSRLTADVVLQSTTTAPLLIQNSVLIGRKLGLDLEYGRGPVEIQNNSLVQAPIAILAGHAASLHVDSGSKLDALEVALKLETSATVILERATIFSKEIAIQARDGLNLQIREGRIESSKDAIVADFGVSIEARKSTLHGGRRVFAFSRRPAALTLIETTLEGEQVYAPK